MTLDASGNLGIGTSSPAVPLDVRSSGFLQANFIAGSANGIQLNMGSSATPANWNIYASNPANYFAVQNGASERMRIDSSGNVGIGTSSPTNAGAGYVNLTLNGSTSSFMDLRSNGGGVGRVQADNANSFGISNIAGASGYTHFDTNGSERMRIDSSGNLLVGTTSTITTGSAGTQISQGGITIGNAGTALTNKIIFMNANGYVGSIQSSGSTTAYNTSSDYRLKENIQPMQNALDVVAQLNPVTYTWKADGSDGQGFIAHELQTVVPDCVTGEKDAVDADGKPVYQGIDTSFLVATLCKAIQELEARVKQLEGK